ncbi:cytoskeletal protein CcmA (bactofilin family) [Natronocella acetinitrilica]|uniref:Cytoskeletal protein CcmA (Bactofilin family) n=1 Tax=Natronocella acetinitrilica TaxID=414046 RepID=A0AAE3KB88_9GAMM|nr:polymer-forming cytoskeletal protein [Natronocella acetinitrilica]MCP1675245.1 cytoskeletal protein CcmA (bactofilin family) [Natronocella acetinitrilica]
MFDIGKRGSGSQKDEQDDTTDSLPGVGMAGTSPASGSDQTAGVRRREAAVIGPSIHIEGTLRGEEDLLIEGHVKGTVQLQGHTLTIGGKGQVEAELHAQSIYVEGTVQGDLYGTELVSIRKSARIFGNVTAPRVSLEDGAKFKGAIDMDVEPARPAAAAPGGTSSGKPQSASGGSGSSGSPGSPPAGTGDKKTEDATKATTSKGSATG